MTLVPQSANAAAGATNSSTGGDQPRVELTLSQAISGAV